MAKKNVLMSCNNDKQQMGQRLKPYYCNNCDTPVPKIVVPFVVVIITFSFPFSCLLTEFLTMWSHQWSRNFLPFRSTSGFWKGWVCVSQLLVFSVVFCGSFFWPLYLYILFQFMASEKPFISSQSPTINEQNKILLYIQLPSLFY